MENYAIHMEELLPEFNLVIKSPHILKVFKDLFVGHGKKNILLWTTPFLLDFSVSHLHLPIIAKGT